MFLFPYDKVTIHGTFGVKRVRNRLSSEIAPVISYMVQVKLNNKMFKGKVTDNVFEIMRVERSRNFFLPFVKGHIEENPMGCSITLTLRPLISSLLVIGIFFLMASIFIFNDIFRTGSFDWKSLIPLAFVCVFYSYMTVLFKDEADFIKYYIAKFAGSNEYEHLQIDESYTVE